MIEIYPQIIIICLNIMTEQASEIRIQVTKLVIFEGVLKNESLEVKLSLGAQKASLTPTTGPNINDLTKSVTFSFIATKSKLQPFKIGHEDSQLHITVQSKSDDGQNKNFPKLFGAISVASLGKKVVVPLNFEGGYGDLKQGGTVTLKNLSLKIITKIKSGFEENGGDDRGQQIGSSQVDRVKSVTKQVSMNQKFELPSLFKQQKQQRMNSEAKILGNLNLKIYEAKLEENKMVGDGKFQIVISYKNQQIKTKELSSQGGAVVWKHAIKMKVSDSKDIIRLTLVSQGRQIGQVEIPIHLMMFKSKFQKWYPLKSGSEDSLNQVKLVSIFEPDQAQLDNFKVLNFQMEKYVEKDKTLDVDQVSTLNVHSIMPEVSSLIPQQNFSLKDKFKASVKRPKKNLVPIELGNGISGNYPNQAKRAVQIDVDSNREEEEALRETKSDKKEESQSQQSEQIEEGQNQNLANPQLGQITITSPKQVFNFEIPAFNAGQSRKQKKKKGFDDDDDEDLEEQEEVSYTRLMKFIEKQHPIDKLTKKSFSVEERVTVKNFNSKICDICNLYMIQEAIKSPIKIIRAKFGQELGNSKPPKPKSMEFEPSSDSESEDYGESLTDAAKTLGQGAVLYLQTMKTLAIMFFVLSVINIPIYQLYSQGIEHDDESAQRILTQWSFGNFGRQERTCGWSEINNIAQKGDLNDSKSSREVPKILLKCHDDNQYIGFLDAMGFLQPYDRKTHQDSFGKSSCFQIKNPDLPPLIHNSEDDSQEEIYFPSLENQKITKYNIDSECSFESMYRDNEHGLNFHHYFEQIFETNCKGFNQCEIDPVLFNLDRIISETCLQRISEKTTHNEFIVVAGCQNEFITVPMTKINLTKESVSLYIVIINGLTMLIITYFFQKIETLNSEYLKIMDNITVQMRDFGVWMQEVKLDRHTQDPRVIKLKVWMFFMNILQRFATDENPMEIIDVTFSRYTDKEVKQILKMQEIQKKINSIRESLLAKIFSDDVAQSQTIEMKQWEEKLQKQKVIYFQMKNTSAKNQIYSPEMTKIPMISKSINKRDQLKKLQYVFVLFKHCETRDYVVDYLKDHKMFGHQIIHALTYKEEDNHHKKSKGPDDSKFLGNSVNVGSLFEPDELNWDNLPITSGQHFRRKIATILVAFFLFLIGILIQIIMKMANDRIIERVPNAYCEGLKVTKQQAYDDAQRKNHQSLMLCYCKQHQQSGEGIPNISFKSESADGGDDFNYCYMYLNLENVKDMIDTMFDVSVVLINSLVALLMRYMVAYQRLYTVMEENVSSFVHIFMMEFTVMGIILIYMSFDPIGLSNIVRGIDDPDDFRSQKKYQGFESDWYFDQGKKLGSYIFLAFLVTNLSDIALALVIQINRFRDRSFSFEMKKDPFDLESDDPNTKIKTQSRLEALYSTRAFQGEKAYSRLMSILFLTLFFSSGIPGLYICAFLFYSCTYLVNKVLLIKFYSRSATFTKTIPLHAQKLLRYGLLTHMICGSFMLTSPTILNLEDDGDRSDVTISYLTQESLELNAETFGFDHFNAKKELDPDDLMEELQSGKMNFNEKMAMVFQDRYKHTYQQVYVGFIIFIVVTYYLGRAIVTSSVFLFRATRAIVKSLIKFSKEVYSNYKQGKGVFQSVKAYLDKRKAEENPPPKIQLTNEQMRQKTMELFRKRVPQRAAEILKEGDFEPIDQDSLQVDNQGAQVQFQGMIAGLSSILSQQKQKQDQLKKEAEQEALQKKEMLKNLYKKKAEKPDFSDNILNELSPENLSNFYERAKRELDEFQGLFHIDKPIGPELTDPDSDHPMRIVFQEICYLNKITTQQVKDYQFILSKRVADIEEMIDKHFNLIKEVLIEKLEKHFRDENERMKREGRELTLAQEIARELKLKDLLQSHPSVQFDDPMLYPYSKKLKKLKLHYEDLIQADKSRRDNRKGLQEICRMTGSETQSFFVFDCSKYKIARKLYFEKMFNEYK